MRPKFVLINLVKISTSEVRPKQYFTQRCMYYEDFQREPRWRKLKSRINYVNLEFPTLQAIVSFYDHLP